MSAALLDSAQAICQAVERGEASALEITQSALERIEALNARLRAFLHIDREQAIAQASAIDRAKKRGEALGPLCGVPIAIKDNSCVRGMPTTCASRVLEGWVAPYDATAVQKLRKAGAVIVGKTNMDEFAMGSSNEYSAFGVALNPWDLSRVPGGSSGGSAAALAARMTPLALGSDTGGSVRQPAAFCGVVGLKPTYGRVSRYGLVAFASSLDQIGPMATDVDGCARLAQAIFGMDPRDATSADRPIPNLLKEKDAPISGLRVGVLRLRAEVAPEPGVEACFAQALRILEDLGCILIEVELPSLEYALAAYYILAPAECSSNLARFDGMRYGPRVESENLFRTYCQTRALFGKEVRRRIVLGTYVLSAGYYEAYYAKAQRARTRIVHDFAKAFEKVDLIASPTAPTVAFPIGSRTEDPVAMYLSDVYT
ncbi:MAG: Asp-tRNA(Asn)/Glu-tRNA(Gln) amidotransferase subunit GatA, partial [Deltaproteobacteria bacterium]|nr:Asp-tRNA(Asn)/Glu-tRNA(Gln) amidotransferase subunit GatA [Deltaproteobacteria bacterium]